MTNLTKAPIKKKTGGFDFAAFDRLPREVRDAINYAAFNCATDNLPRLVGKHGGRSVATSIKEWDAKQVAEAYEVRNANDFLQELGL